MDYDMLIELVVFVGLLSSLWLLCASLYYAFRWLFRWRERRAIARNVAEWVKRPPEPIYTVADIHFFAEMQRKLGEE